MKTKILFTFLFLMFGFVSLLIAQLPVCPQNVSNFQVIDYVDYTITYDVTIVTNPADLKKTVTDKQVLQIGKNVSSTFSFPLYENDSVCTQMLKKGAANLPLYQSLVSPENIYKNYPKNKITVTYRSFMDGPVMKYEEPIPEFNWTLLPERKKILSYQCQKAICTFRGRNYTAWFTSEIPFKDGPYKFGGLPGLILQITDSKNHFNFLCIGIKKNKNEEQSIKFWKWNYQNSTREKVRPFIKRMYERPNAFFKSLTGKGIRMMNGQNADLLSYPYNPIELE